MSDPGTSSASQRHWFDLRLITTGIVILAMSVILWGLFGPEPPLVVSRETTFITAPLDAEGLPDYRAYLLSLYGPAPPPEENAAVPLLQVFWPMGMTTPAISAVCVALGIPDAPPADSPLTDPEDDATLKAEVPDLEATCHRPWTGREHPTLEQWLEKSMPAIDRLVAASQRPRYWFPNPELLQRKQARMAELTLPDTRAFRSAGRALSRRAMWHLAAGRTREAWNDILGVHRLSRMMAPSRHPVPTLVAHLVATAVAGQANKATRTLLTVPALSAAERDTIHRDLAALPPIHGERALAMERLLGIDCIVALAARRDGTSRLELARHWSGVGPTLPTFVLATSLDWNIVLSIANTAYEELERTGGTPPAAGAGSSASWEATIGRMARLLVSRPERSKQAARVIAEMVVPAVAGYVRRVSLAEADFEALLKEAVAPVKE